MRASLVWIIVVLVALLGVLSCSEQAPPERAEPTAPSPSASTPVTRALDEALAAHPEVAWIVPRVSGVILDEDPDSPVAASIAFGPDSPATRLDFVGPKVGVGEPAAFALLHFEGLDEAIRIELDVHNRPRAAWVPDIGVVVFDYSDATLTVSFLGLDETASSYEVDLAPAPAAAASTSGRMVSAVPAVAPARPRPAYPELLQRALQEISATRGVRVDVVLEGLSETPPRGMEPFVRTADCTEANLTCTFWSAKQGNFWSMGITHTATFSGDVPSPDWPDVETCEAAKTRLAPWVGGLTASTIAPAAVPALVDWLAAIGIGSGAGAAAGAGPAVLLGTVGAVAFSLGVEVGELLRGEVDCSAVLRRVSAHEGLLSGVQAKDFVVNVCFPAQAGIIMDAACQRVGPYRPFAGDVELGTLTFHASLPPLEVTSLAVDGLRVGEPFSATATVRGGRAPYTFAWSAPGATNPQGESTDADGGAVFTFPRAGTFPITVVVTDADGRTSRAEAAASVVALAPVTARGSVSASTTYPGFSPQMAVDGSRATSWFSAGSDGEGRDVSVFTWLAAEDLHIGRVSIFGNGNHAVADFRTGFGFNTVTVQVSDSAGNLIWQDTFSLAGTPDPDVIAVPDAFGNRVTLIFAGHEAPDCGGFSELIVEAWIDGW